jgi:hypothetical protein
MVDIHFINDPTTLLVLQTILSAAGPNYGAPYDSSVQPSNGAGMNTDNLLQYKLPGGATINGMADPAESKSMGSAINSLLATLSPFVSAYIMVLPILGIIRGILEVICAMMNPFAVIRAVIRLFKKWIPAFISLFPPLAGIILILGIIKVILAVVFFIMTVVLPVIQLIISNVKTLAASFDSDSNKQTRDAGRMKLQSLILELLNQLGILSVLKAILDLVYMVLKLSSGKPCKKGKKKKKKNKFDLTDIETGVDELSDDDTCCDEDVCPPVFSKPPSGKALVIPSFFSEAPPLFAWNIIPLTGQDKLAELKPYLQSLKPQLDAQLDEPIDEARTAGQTGDSAHFRIKLTGKRGNGQSKIVPIAKLSGSKITGIDPSLLGLMGVVDYEIVPNWEILIGRNIIGLGCHPDITKARDDLDNRYPDIDEPAVDKFPELIPVQTAFDDMVARLNNDLSSLSNVVADVIFKNPVPTGNTEIIVDGAVVLPGATPPGPIIPGTTPPYPDTRNVPVLQDETKGIFSPVDMGIYIDNTEPKDPPYDNDITRLNNIQNNLINTLNNYMDGLRNAMSSVLSKIEDPINTGFDVDKNLIKSDNLDKAIIQVTPRDATGSLIAKQLPQGVSINVSLFTDFGTIVNQVNDNTTGIITADLISLFPGTATITAKINTKYAQAYEDGQLVTKKLKVRFVSDAILPKRRLVSKSSAQSTKHSTFESSNGGNNG